MVAFTRELFSLHSLIKCYILYASLFDRLFPLLNPPEAFLPPEIFVEKIAIKVALAVLRAEPGIADL